MRIFSKSSLQFNHPKDHSMKASVRPGEFKDVPDWVKGSVMFKLASKDGNVMLVENKSQEIAAETNKKSKGNKGGKVETNDQGGNDNPPADPPNEVNQPPAAPGADE